MSLNVKTINCSPCQLYNVNVKRRVDGELTLFKICVELTLTISIVKYDKMILALNEEVFSGVYRMLQHSPIS